MKIFKYSLILCLIGLQLSFASIAEPNNSATKLKDPQKTENLNKEVKEEIPTTKFETDESKEQVRPKSKSSTSSDDNDMLLKVDIKVWLALIAFMSSLFGAVVVHYLSRSRDLYNFENQKKFEQEKLKEQRDYELKGIASAFIAEIEYLQKLTLNRKKTSSEIKAMKKPRKGYLNAMSYPTPLIYNSYIGQVSPLGPFVSGQLIRYYATVEDFNDLVKIAMTSDVELSQNILDTLIAQLNTIEKRALVTTTLLSLIIEGEDLSIESQTEIIKKARGGNVAIRQKH